MAKSFLLNAPLRYSLYQIVYVADIGVSTDSHGCVLPQKTLFSESGVTASLSIKLGP